MTGTIVIEDPVIPEAPKEPEVVMKNVQAQPVTLLLDSVCIDLGNGRTKSVSYEDFIGILSKCVGSTGENSGTGFQLPYNCFYFSVSANSIRLSCYHPEGNKPFQYTHDSTIKEVVAPNVIISYALTKNGDDWVTERVSYFCTDVPVNRLPSGFIQSVNGERGIGLVPFTNAYSDARMCYGNNTMPSRCVNNDLRRLSYYYEFMWTTPFNDDLGIYDKVEGYEIIRWYKALQTLAKGNKPFPYNLLRRFTVGSYTNAQAGVQSEVVVSNDDLREDDEDED